MKLFSFRPIFIAVLAAFSAWVISDFSKYRLGPDLSGGTILVYQVATDGQKNMDRLIAAIKKRVDPSGIYDYKIRPIGDDRIELVMPKSVVADKEQVKKLVSTVGQLQFRIVANRRMHADIIDRADAEWPKKVVGSDAIFIRYGTWTPVDKTVEVNKAIVDRADAEWAKGNRTIDRYRFVPVTLLDDEKPDAKIHDLKRTESGLSMILATWSDDENIADLSKGNLVKEDEDGNHYILMIEPPETMKVDGEYLTGAERSLDGGNQAVSFKLNPIGAAKFWELTSAYKPLEDGHHNQLGVVLDNRVRSAPVINQPIRDSGVIRMGNRGNVKEEVERLLRVLDAGALPAAVSKEPISEYGIAATLGQDTIDRGKISNVLALVAVMIFMVVYYRFAGCVAVFGLILNILFTVALMVLFKATWTLPGLAGLVLTVGMSVDANVLIYERMREELERGASLGMAIRLGFDKALATIIDSHVTTIVTAVILFFIGTDQVRGFAVTLILGIATSLFAALYIARTCLDFAYSNRWITRLHMLKFLSNHNFDFMAIRKYCYAGSGIMILLGILAFVVRGQESLDIDFTGGTMVALTFKEPLDTAKVRELASAELPDVSVEKVDLRGRQEGTYFIVRTTDRDDKKETPNKEGVRERLTKHFKPYLTFTKISVSKIEKIPPKGAPGEATREAVLKRFAGGEMATIEFDSLHSDSFVREKINEVINASRPEITHFEDIYAVQAIGQAVVETTAVGEVSNYKQFKIEMASGLDEMLKKFAYRVENEPSFDQYIKFGPQVAADTQIRALWAIALSCLGIIVYIWFRFNSWAFGIGGVVALLHDVFIALGIFSIVSIIAKHVPGLEKIYITEMKIDLNVIAAVMTLIGYSIMDTIVVYDRIREVRGKATTISDQLANRGMNETLSRTVITSVLTLLTVVVLYFGCGVTLRAFSFLMVVGIITGTYSSIFVATPLAIALMRFHERREAAKAVAAGRIPVPAK